MIIPTTPATESELEILTILQEECAEVIQIIAKIKRFGWDSHHPNDPSRTNRRILENEVGDLKFMVDLLVVGDVINPDNIMSSYALKRTKLSLYSNVYEP